MLKLGWKTAGGRKEKFAEFNGEPARIVAR